MSTQGRYDVPAPEPEEASAPKKCILVIDDDRFNLKVLQGYLLLDGFEVVLAESGPEGLQRLDAGGVDLVVLDVRMPGMDGYEVCRRIRSDASRSRLPVIFLTADQADERRELMGLDAGGDEYLHKPISRHLLSARVRNLLRLADAERERRLVQQMAHSEKLAALGQVAAGVAHEVNNPLSFVLSNLDSLRAYFEDLKAVLHAWRESPEAGRAMEKKVDLEQLMADITPLLDETVHGGRRVRAIVQELKSFSRNDGAILEAVDLAEVARSTLLLTERELCAKAQLERDFAPARVQRAPRQKLHQMLLNLVVNAMQAVDARQLDDGGRHRIRIATRTVEDWAVLEVSDTGCGIAAEHLSRVFEPFFTTKPVGVGTGLGLSVCALAVERTGGTIDVHSTPGVGTTFTVRLPVAGPPDAPSEED